MLGSHSLMEEEDDRRVRLRHEVRHVAGESEASLDVPLLVDGLGWIL